MGLDDMTLSPFLVKKLYENNLIVEGEFQNPLSADKTAKDSDLDISEKKNESKKNDADLMKYLGKNEKNILLLVNIETHAFLDDASLNFLMNILNACTISMQDVALVNVHGNVDATYEKLSDQFSPSNILFFDTAPHLLNFPVQIPLYKIQKYNNQQYLCAASLSELERNVEEKKKLWGCLKVMFGI